jgi:hypothetical protein
MKDNRVWVLVVFSAIFTEKVPSPYVERKFLGLVNGTALVKPFSSKVKKLVVTVKKGFESKTLPSFNVALNVPNTTSPGL